ncbi:sterol desaturase family protein [Mucilaginibacter achroorhodeus]|uniref:Sterol desaturase family protein n=1 Tax=Mucilaginibacter achroorhodeus TaxID=2599294 RepID=A0A563U0U3_9SPHI|nr:sterol desaturase family protein [Mucilaginibacter achroorhodeus]TWR24632.1 sterol desaturase family protein [Mucilaginibacter achroorhodeus]
MQGFIDIIIRIFSVTAIRYFVIAGVPFLIFYVFFKGRFERSRIQTKRAADVKDFLREILHSMQTTAVFTIIALVLLFTPLRDHTLIYSKVTDYPTWWIPVSLVISLVIHDTYFYWMHRLLHHPVLFKYTHLVHHKSVTPSPWASYSFHFFEAWTEGFVLVVLAFTLPMHPITIGLFTVVGFIINVYGHLGFEIAPKRLRNSMWFNIINTSTYHNLHHSKFRGNYSLYFRHWDKLMKTENPDYEKEYDKIQARRFGADAIQQQPLNAAETIREYSG